MKNVVEVSMREGGASDAVSSDSIAADRAAEIIRATIPDTKEPVWLIAAIVVVAMGLRPGIASIGPVLPAISRAFLLSHAMASLLATVPILLMGLLLIPSAWLATRFGRSDASSRLNLHRLHRIAAKTHTRGVPAQREAHIGHRFLRHRHRILLDHPRMNLRGDPGDGFASLLASAQHAVDGKRRPHAFRRVRYDLIHLTLHIDITRVPVPV
ncbi:hypothetical protein [Paraburkholderia sp.]|uniref:hypothetical protein n=1 Tax=Paraburkholderia sp. TaxID=1926495 RepID=UPI0039C94547